MLPAKGVSLKEEVEQVKQPGKWPPEYPRHQQAEQASKNGSNGGSPKQVANGPSQRCLHHRSQHESHDLHTFTISPTGSVWAEWLKMFKDHPEVNRSLAGDIRETVFDKSRIAEQLAGSKIYVTMIVRTFMGYFHRDQSYPKTSGRFKTFSQLG